MSIFYDPHSKKPLAWTYILFIAIPVVLFLAIYLYGQRKVQMLPEDTQANSVFE
ncbi:MAG: hypothetical protein HGA80_07070 [Candidatus Omnitrophica bacterium]|nr:hypothetical protein [Candidatus Omnitrophota bacterium]